MQLADAIIFENDTAVLKAIAEGADVNEHDRFGMRPLIQAVICRKPAVLDALLVAGADIEQSDFINRTALQWAADRNEVELCFYLLSRGANPNHYSADGQPILVNPILREQLELVELFINFKVNYQFAQDFISAKLLGHRFELTGEADIVSHDRKFIPLSFEGFNLEFSTDLLRRSLHNFINSIPGQKFIAHEPKLQRVLQALKGAAQLTEYGRHKDKSPFANAIDTALDSDLLLLPAAYQGHAITFIKYGNLWVKCDRGVGPIANTVVISEIGNPFAANKDLYSKILYEYKTDEYVKHDIPKLLGLKILTTLPTRHQLSGNCSWANVETSVPAMMYVLSYLPQIHTDARLLSNLQREIFAFYNAWVDWDKDTALDEAIEDFESADATRRISKAVILGSILVQRCNPKINAHVKRAKKILSILMQPNYNFIVQNFCTVFYKKKAGKAGQRVQRLFKLCGINPETITMKKPVQYLQTNVHSENLVRMTTALHVAALHGQLEVVKHLVEELDIDIDYLDRTGSTALMYAAYAGHREVVEYLILHGANTAIKNLKGGTAAKYAAYAGFRDIVDMIHSVS